MTSIVLWFSGHASYFAAHPELFALVLWPLLTGLASFANTKIAARFPTLAAFLAKSGFDAKGAVKIVWNAIAKSLSLPMMMALFLVGCVAAQTFAKDATGVACELVIQDAEPGLSNLPVCTTVEEVEQAIADWLSTHVAANLASGQLSPHEKYLAVRAYQSKKGAKK